MRILLAVVVFWPALASALCGPAPTGSPAPSPAFHKAPTETGRFRLRLGAGEYLAGRARGAHQGIDIVATSLTPSKDAYRVVAGGGGKVAFVGNSDPAGYGYTVIIDHGNGEYSLYAHLAANASRVCTKLGDWVQEGQVIGYLYDPATGEMSSGNAAALTGVQPWEHIQVHVELIGAPAGRQSSTTSGPIKTGATISDPTPRLRQAGYSGP
jgi:murein DD-endopeptidase MepM/ murein hydrolase activator NlpD